MNFEDLEVGMVVETLDGTTSTIVKIENEKVILDKFYKCQLGFTNMLFEDEFVKVVDN